MACAIRANAQRLRHCSVCGKPNGWQHRVFLLVDDRRAVAEWVRGIVGTWAAFSAVTCGVEDVAEGSHTETAGLEDAAAEREGRLFLGVVRDAFFVVGVLVFFLVFFAVVFAAVEEEGEEGEKTSAEEDTDRDTCFSTWRQAVVVLHG